jgi:hypothetical protein
MKNLIALNTDTSRALEWMGFNKQQEKSMANNRPRMLKIGTPPILLIGPEGAGLLGCEFD